METVFVGAGAFLSFLVRDDEQAYSRALELFERAEAGRLKLETNELVLLEVVRELETTYALTRETVADVLEAVLGTRNLRVPERRVLKRAVELYASGKVAFIEAYNRAYAHERGLRYTETAQTGTAI